MRGKIIHYAALVCWCAVPACLGFAVIIIHGG